eukprot:CAMPEP_0170499794 /NCGR_PEP_ID=MMETSP0208-20121228/32606_1 /TAXON_ID=197538 /ORGANISM="Strombidium inclinatum, Strain S3" /LENGTH=45 /DNA_ID= /DNA_START= /DNA_END= /DNA_ORIENTATION=
MSWLRLVEDKEADSEDYVEFERSEAKKAASGGRNDEVYLPKVMGG